MRQALAAGDDTPRTPRVPQAPLDPHDAHDQQSPQDPQGRDDRQPDLVVRAGSPAALLTLVPRLLGFVPEASLVVIGSRRLATASGSRSATTCPTRPTRPGLVAGIGAHAVGVLRTQRLTAAVAVAYGPETLVTPAADELRDAAWQAEFDLREFLRVQDGRC